MSENTQNTMTVTQPSSQTQRDLDTIIMEHVDTYTTNNQVRYMSATQVRSEILDEINEDITLENYNRDKGNKLPTLKKMTPYIVARIALSTGFVRNIRLGSLVVPCVYIEDGVREGVWQPIVSVSDDAFLRQYLRKYYPAMSVAEYNEVKSYIQDASNLEIIKETTDSRYVACANGVYDVYDKVHITWSQAFDKGLVFTSKLGVDYVETPTNKIFHDKINHRDITVVDVLKEIAGDDEHYEALIAAMHLMIRKNWASDVAVLLVDPAMTGKNGKSTVCTVLQGILGDGNYTSIAINAMNDTFALSPLLTCGAVINADADDSSYIEHSEKFKMLSSGDSITINVKFKEPVSGFRFTGHIFQAINGFPKFKETSTAIDRRFYFIDCTTHFDDIRSCNIKKNARIKDEFLKDKEVLEYVLKMLLDLGYETLPEYKFQQDIKKQFRSETNPVDAFLDYITSVDTAIDKLPHWDGYYPTTWLYSAFCGFYYENYRKRTTMSRKSFNASMRFWVEKHADEWEIPTNSKGELMSVSTQGRMDEAEAFTEEFMSHEAGNMKEMVKWCNELFMSSTDIKKKCRPSKLNYKYTCLRRIKPSAAAAVGVEEEDE